MVGGSGSRLPGNRKAHVVTQERTPAHLVRLRPSLALSTTESGLTVIGNTWTLRTFLMRARAGTAQDTCSLDCVDMTWKHSDKGDEFADNFNDGPLTDRKGLLSHTACDGTCRTSISHGE